MEEEIFRKIVSEELKSASKEFYIPREKHYKDHIKFDKIDDSDIIFLREIRETFSVIKNTAWTNIIRAVIYGGVAIFVMGLIYWVTVQKDTVKPKDVLEEVKKMNKKNGIN